MWSNVLCECSVETERDKVCSGSLKIQTGSPLVSFVNLEELFTTLIHVVIQKMNIIVSARSASVRIHGKCFSFWVFKYSFFSEAYLNLYYLLPIGLSWSDSFFDSTDHICICTYTATLLFFYFHAYINAKYNYFIRWYSHIGK